MFPVLVRSEADVEGGGTTVTNYEQLDLRLDRPSYISQKQEQAERQEASKHAPLKAAPLNAVS